MIEIFHSTRDLSMVLKEGLKAPYQLGLEGKQEHVLLPKEIDNPKTSKITRFLSKSIFFFEESPAGDEWVSIMVDENDRKIKVGNISLVELPYMPGRLYEKSIMNLPTYLKRKKQAYQPGKEFENPFTARMINWEEMEKFEEEWGKELERKLLGKSIFAYRSEILVPRLIIAPSEFNRHSLNCY